MNNFVQFKYLKLIQRKCLCQFQYFNGIFPFQQEGNLTISWNRISKFEKRQYWKELFTLWRNQLSVDCVNINFPGHKFQYGVKKKKKNYIYFVYAFIFWQINICSSYKGEGFPFMMNPGENFTNLKNKWIQYIWIFYIFIYKTMYNIAQKRRGKSILQQTAKLEWENDWQFVSWKTCNDIKLPLCYKSHPFAIALACLLNADIVLGIDSIVVTWRIF